MSPNNLGALKRGRTRVREEQAVTRTLDRGLALLETLSNRLEASLSDLARDIGVTPTTASRLLDTLQLRGFVQQDDRGIYTIGVKAFIVGSAVTRVQRLDQVAVPSMIRLSQQVLETVSLAIRDQDALVYLEQIEGPSAVRVTAQLGKRIPLHSAAAGKVLLSAVWEAALDSILGAEPYPALTPSTITDHARLIAEIDEVRARGWALDNQESQVNLCCIAAPVRDRRAEVVAALSISTFAGNHPCNRLRALAGDLVNAANDISMKLGWQAELNAPHHNENMFGD